MEKFLLMDSRPQTNEVLVSNTTQSWISKPWEKHTAYFQHNYTELKWVSTQQHQSYAEAPEQVPLTEIAHMNPLPAHKVPCIWYLKYLGSNYTKTFPKSSLITIWPFGRAGIEVEFVTPTFIISSVKVRMQYAFSHTHLSSKYSPAARTCAITQDMSQEHLTAQQQNESSFLCFPERLLQK